MDPSNLRNTLIRIGRQKKWCHALVASFNSGIICKGRQSYIQNVFTVMLHTTENQWQLDNFFNTLFIELISKTTSKLHIIGLLTHWGWVTHIFISKLTGIASDNGLLPGWHQSIIWTNAGILLIGPLGTNFSEILIIIHTFSFKKMHQKGPVRQKSESISMSWCHLWFVTFSFHIDFKLISICDKF